ncbi:hypothetical protein [Polaribacter sp. Asnod6-C07]|uniref:hypothetical protein n=1 Tax=Polaribacter sp. Asnod6-C07 TaxID=3160582 RepID=UPI0038672689
MKNFIFLILFDPENGTTLSKFFYNSYIVEISGGIVLSAMGLFLIWFLRPKVKIAPKIASSVKGGKNIYKIKVINKSYLFQLVDIQFELTMLQPQSTPKGMNIHVKKIPLKSNHMWFLSRRKGKFHNLFSTDIYATYAILITLQDDFDLLNEWKNKAQNGTYFDLKVIAKNNFSGITSIAHEKFNHYACIKPGGYCHGNSMEIESHD